MNRRRTALAFLTMLGVQRHIMRAYERLVSPKSSRGFPTTTTTTSGRGAGRSCEPAGSRHAVLATKIAVLLSQHTEANDLGAVMTPAGFELEGIPIPSGSRTSPSFTAVTSPTPACLTASGPAPPIWPSDQITGDRPSEISAKVGDYLARGVRLVWVVDSKKKTVTAHVPQLSPVTLGMDDVLDAGDVVPASRPGPPNLRLIGWHRSATGITPMARFSRRPSGRSCRRR